MLFIDRWGGAAWTMSDSLYGTDYVYKLESRLGELTGKSAVAMCSAEAALHTALSLCGVRRGDYVFVPSRTFYSNITTVTNIGAIPVFIDSEPLTRCMSQDALETAFMWARLQNKSPAAVVIDNAFGAVADYDVLIPLCKANGAAVIELACDSIFGEYKGVACGGNGDYGIINLGKRACGGGGALILRSDDVGRARAFVRRTYSDGESHDYGMHNALAALDCALLPAAAKTAERCKSNLSAICRSCENVLSPTEGDAATYAVLAGTVHAAALRAKGFDVITPPAVHTMAKYRNAAFFEHEPEFSVSTKLCDSCLINTDMSALRCKKLIRLLRTL